MGFMVCGGTGNNLIKNCVVCTVPSSSFSLCPWKGRGMYRIWRNGARFGSLHTSAFANRWTKLVTPSYLRDGALLALLAATGATCGVLVHDHINQNYTWRFPAKVHASSSGDVEDLVEWVTMDEVAKHNTAEDCWVVLDGKVYDVTSLLSNHPGGNGILLAHAGKDVTDQFHWLQHSNMALQYLPGLHVANAKASETPKEAAKPSKVSVLVVGAGICGVAVAYYLCKAGYDVTVLEDGPMVGGTALKSSAILFLGPLLERDDAKAEESATAWTGDQAADSLLHVQRNWEDIQFERRPLLGILQTAEQRGLAASLYGPNGRLHGQGKLLTAEEARALEPALSPNIHGALLSDGATCDPFLACNAFAKRAQGLGADFRFRHRVSCITRLHEGGFSVKATLLPSHTDAPHLPSQPPEQVELVADRVLLCVGWKANEMLQALGHADLVPVAGMHGQMFATQHPSLQLKHMLYSYEGPHHWMTKGDKHRSTLEATPPYKRVTRHLYGNQIANGVLKFGGDRVRTDVGHVLEDGIQVSFDHICEVLPAIKDCTILGSWSGVMPFTPDQKLILGELEPGLFVLTGAPFTKGVVAGQLLAELVQGMSEHAQQLKEFDPQRFAKPQSAQSTTKSTPEDPSRTISKLQQQTKS
eukprot:g60298.t1